MATSRGADGYMTILRTALIHVWGVSKFFDLGKLGLWFTLSGFQTRSKLSIHIGDMVEPHDGYATRSELVST